MQTRFFLAGWGWRVVLGVALIITLLVVIYTLSALMNALNAGVVV